MFFNTILSIRHYLRGKKKLGYSEYNIYIKHIHNY